MAQLIPLTRAGRIRRISLDALTPTNYTLQETSSYNALDPAGTVSSWGSTPDVEAMDLSFSTPFAELTPLTKQGVLITFERTLSYFSAVSVKVKPTYDTEAGEDPYFEMWVFTDAWVLAYSRQFASPFSDGIPTGRRRYMDFTLSSDLAGVSKVWVTMNPGNEGAPSLDWLCIHVFGKCTNVPVTPGDCADDPTVDCIPEQRCETNPLLCEVPILDCEDIDPTGELCNDPPYDWPGPPKTGPDPIVPRTLPPEFPLIDLCDPAAIASYKTLLTPDQLAFFEELLGAMELPCLDDIGDPPVRQPDPVAPINLDPTTLGPLLPRQPVEVYTDPKTLQPANDPKKTSSGGGGSSADGLRTKRFILTWSGNDAVEALALVGANLPPVLDELPPNILDPQVLQGNWGPNVGIPTFGVAFTPEAYGLRITLNGLPIAVQVGIRVQTLRLRGAVDVLDSISSDGVRLVPPAGGCPAQHDWIVTPDITLVPADNVFIGNLFQEYFYSNLIEYEGQDAEADIVLALPRENDTTQNDAAVCDATFKERSELGHDRAGCLVGFVAKQKDVWLFPWENATYDGEADFGAYRYHHRPYVIVIDVAFQQVLDDFSVQGCGVTLSTTGLTGAPIVEVC
jgi:hypothetical protein